MALASYPPSSFSFFENGLSEQLSRTMVYANLQPLEEHSPRVAPVAGGLLPHLLTLTAALAPHSRGRTTQRRLFSSALSRCRQRLPFSEAERSLLPGLSSRPLPLSLHQHLTSRCNRGLAVNCERGRKGPATNQATALPRAKVIKLFHSTNICYAIFFISKRERVGDNGGRSYA